MNSFDGGRSGYVDELLRSTNQQNNGTRIPEEVLSVWCREEREESIERSRECALEVAVAVCYGHQIIIVPILTSIFPFVVPAYLI